MCAASPARNSRPCRIGVCTKLRIGSTLLSVIGPGVSFQPSWPWPSRVASASQIRSSDQSRDVGAVGHLQVEPAHRGRAHRVQGEAVGVPGVDQLVGRRRDVGEDAEPGVRVGPLPGLPDRRRHGRPARARTSRRSRRPRRRRAAARAVGIGERDVGPVGVQVVQRGVGDLVDDCCPARRGPRPGPSAPRSGRRPRRCGRPGRRSPGGAARPATAGRCRGARRPRACSRSPSPADVEQVDRGAAPGCRPGSGPRRSPASGSRSRPSRRRPGRAGGTSSRPAGPAPMMATWVRMPLSQRPSGASAGKPALPLSGSQSAGCGRCPAPPPAGPTPAGPGPAAGPAPRCRARPPPRPPVAHRHRHRAGAQAHLLAGGGVAVAADPAQLLEQPAGLGDGVRGDPGQVAQHLGRTVLRRVGQQHLADAGGVHRQPRPDLADHRHRRVPGQPVDVEHLECRRGPPGARWRAWRRRGRAGTARRPGAARSAPGRAARGPRSAGRPRTRRSSRRTRAPHADQLADQPVRGGQRQAGAPGELGQASGCGARVERAEQASTREVTRPGAARCCRPSGHPFR